MNGFDTFGASQFSSGGRKYDDHGSLLYRVAQKKVEHTCILCNTCVSTFSVPPCKYQYVLYFQ